MSPPSSPVFSKHYSNLQSFLSSVTPTVGSQALQQDNGDTIEYLILGDLWDCYEEWSAYGVGVPIVLNNGKSVTQYYAPYLSAIQIFTNNPQQTSRYPIYYIPTMGKCKKCLPTCFLTCHTLSSSPQEITDLNADKNGIERCNKSVDELVKGEEGKFDLYPFGLVTYKLEDEIWINSDNDNERINDLYKAAESWLKQLNFWHHDFIFFTS